MARPTIRSPTSSFGSIRFSAITSMLSQVGPASTEGSRCAPCAQRLDRIARVIIELAAVGAVQAVVQVVPPVPLALRAAHDARDADGGGTGDEAPGLGDHAHAPGSFASAGADRRAEARMSHRVLQIVDREAAADIEGIRVPSCSRRAAASSRAQPRWPPHA